MRELVSEHTRPQGAHACASVAPPAPRAVRTGLTRVGAPLRLSEVHVDRKTALEGRGLRATPKDAPEQARFRLRGDVLPVGGNADIRDRTCIGAEHVKRSRFV